MTQQTETWIELQAHVANVLRWLERTEEKQKDTRHDRHRRDTREHHAGSDSGVVDQELNGPVTMNKRLGT